jgi:hypothetical protein
MSESEWTKLLLERGEAERAESDRPKGRAGPIERTPADALRPAVPPKPAPHATEASREERKGAQDGIAEGQTDARGAGRARSDGRH